MTSRNMFKKVAFCMTFILTDELIMPKKANNKNEKGDIIRGSLYHFFGVTCSFPVTRLLMTIERPAMLTTFIKLYKISNMLNVQTSFDVPFCS